MLGFGADGHICEIRAGEGQRVKLPSLQGKPEVYSNDFLTLAKLLSS